MAREGSPLRALITGLQLPEALRSDGDALYFSDAAAGGVYRWRKGMVETVVPKRRGVGGLALHAEGGIVISGRTLVHVRDGEVRELFAADGALGLNDLTTDVDGSVLVGALRMDWREPEGGQPGEVWRVHRDGAEQLITGIAYPNGMAFSPDGRTLYVADYVGARVHVIEVATRAHRRFVDLERGNADGLAVDAAGRVWVATGPNGSFDVFDTTGALVDRLTPPEDFAVTLCFGNEDPYELYLAAGRSIYRARSDVPGLPAVRAQV
ncbi:MAG TPA: SMP-30/gluconolactonase/LRE family protein [Candidatus Dormibacteraeota bacterium]|nr:SMP-30/gluconolactonase/LRE family protein [Candidatus Dormibacteraeota bacterium]